MKSLIQASLTHLPREESSKTVFLVSRVEGHTAQGLRPGFLGNTGPLLGCGARAQVASPPHLDSQPVAITVRLTPTLSKIAGSAHVLDFKGKFGF